MLREELKVKNPFCIYAVEGVHNRENLKSLLKFFLEVNMFISKTQPFDFWGHFLGCSDRSTSMTFTLDTVLIVLKKYIKVTI